MSSIYEVLILGESFHVSKTRGIAIKNVVVGSLTETTKRRRKRTRTEYRFEPNAKGREFGMQSMAGMDSVDTAKSLIRKMAIRVGV